MTAATGDSLSFGYDALKRLNRVTVKNGSSVILNTAYAYRDVSWNRGSAQVEFRNVRLGSDSGMLLEGKKYVYDDVGNLKEIRESTGKYNKLVEYAYDSQNQLTSEAYYKSGEAEAYITYNYTYDTAGNLLTVSQKEGDTTTLLQTYTYGDAQWHDLLTAVNGQAITYDASGNPLSYGGWSFGWQNGRQLKMASKTSDGKTETLEYSYDADGIRTSKTYTVETFTQVPDYTVTFQADGTTVKTMNVTEGYTLKDSDYPAVPTKSGYSGAWKPYTAAIHNDITINAVYTALKTKHTVIFFADGKALKTMQVDNGYTLKASDYPSIPEKDGYTGRWDTRVTRITKDTAIYAIYSNNSTHTVTFIFAEVERNTLTVADGYILKDSDYPVPLIPSKDPSAVAAWKKYTAPIHEDITVRGNWQGGAVLPTEPSYPDEIMSGGEGEPVEADEPEENGAEPYSAGAMDEADTITHDYLTQSGRVARETIRQSVGGTVLKTETLDFFYDESGRPFAFNYSVDGGIASTYYYILNLQGDVVQIIDANGVMQAEYVYSPWGEVISAEGGLAEINPLRYRGYYYDSETGFYYLQSRYYDPENHRFINADTYASTDSGDAISCNVFAYCLNDPVNRSDSDGNKSLKDIAKSAIKGFVKHVVKPVNNWTAKQISKLDFTYSTGLGLSGSFGIWNMSGQLGLSIDSGGNVEMQYTVGGAVTTGSGVSLMNYQTITNAPNVTNLHDDGYQVGASVGVPIYNIPAAAGADINIIPDTDANRTYYGFTSGAGLGTPGMEAHVGWSTTRPVKGIKFNINEIFSSFYDKILGW